MEERKKLWNSTQVECCSCGREPSERRTSTRKSQTLLYTRLKQPPELITFYTGIKVECIGFFFTPCWFCERFVLTHCTAGHVKFQWTWQQRKEKETEARGWALLLTLCKLRPNFSQEDLAMRFGVNQSTVSRLYSCWTKIFEACINEYHLWPDKTSIQESVPAALKNLYPDTCVIINAAGIETACNCSLSQPYTLTWFDYKRRTFKSCIHSPVHFSQ